MTLQAQQIHVAYPEHVNVGAPVRNMAGGASLDFHRLVLEYERSLFIGVAGEADGILRGRSAHLLRPNCTVHVVTIRALDEPLVHTMVEGHFELGLFSQMARVAELRLCFHQQELFGLRMVRRVAGDAADIVSRVDRVDRIHMLRATGVATQAAIDNRFCGNVLECEDLGDIAAAIDVRLAGTMASFAALLGWAAQFVERGFPVRGLFPSSINVVVARFAGFRSNIFRRRFLVGCGSRGG